MRSRVMAFLFAALLSVSLPGGWAHAAFGGTTGDLTWTLSDDGTLTIAGEGKMPDYMSSLELRPPWFSGRDDIKSVVVGEAVESIGAYAFSNCENLERISLPDSLERIGECAFYISGLEAIAIPKGVRTIENAAFQECEALKEIRVAEDDPSFSDREGILFNKDQTALLYCPKGKGNEVRLPASLKRVARCALIDCTGLTEILFEGTSEQWQAVEVEEGNDPLQKAEIRYVEPIVQQPEIQKLDLTDIRVEYNPAPGYLWEGSLGVQSIHAKVTGPCDQCYIRIAGVTDSKPAEEEAWNTAKQAVQDWRAEGKPFTTKTPYSFGKTRPIYPEDLNKIQYVLLAGQDGNGDLVGYGIIETPPVSDTPKNDGKQGTLTAQDGSGTVTWTLQNTGGETTVLVEGDVSPAYPVLAAVYESGGRMLSVKRLTGGQILNPEAGDVVKLFWLSAETGAPVSGCAVIPLAEKDG